MWVKFTADFDWKPKPSVTICYQSGSTKNVTRACADRAVASGKANKTVAPKRSENGGRKS